MFSHLLSLADMDLTIRSFFNIIIGCVIIVTGVENC